MHNPRLGFGYLAVCQIAALLRSASGLVVRPLTTSAAVSPLAAAEGLPSLPLIYGNLTRYDSLLAMTVVVLCEQTVRNARVPGLSLTQSGFTSLPQ